MTHLQHWRAGLPAPTLERFDTVLYTFEYWAIAYSTVVIVIGMLAFDRRGRTRAVALVGILLAVGAANSVGKWTFGRERPAEARRSVGAYVTIFRGPAGAYQTANCQSFPSGHSAAAMGQSAVLAVFYPALAPVWYALWAAVSVERVYHHKHFLSDVVAGALLAHAIAWGLLRRPGFERGCRRLARRLPLPAGRG